MEKALYSAKATTVNRGKGKKTSIVIVDDHPLVRRGLSQLIQEEENLEVCGEAGTVPEALSKIKELQPDLVIVDISLPEVSGLELIKQISQEETGTKVLVASIHDDNLMSERALRAGAWGYVHKQKSPEEVLEAIRSVAAGKVYLSEEVSQRILQRMRGTKEPQEKSRLASLSDRELEVFELIGGGLATRQIGESLHVSSKTVETYKEHIKVKLGLHTSTELLQHAVLWMLYK